MTPLFSGNSDIRIVKFLNENKHKFGILATPDFIADIYYKNRGQINQPEFQFPLLTIAIDTLNDLNKKSADGDENRTYIVADEMGEGDRVKQLKKNYPNISFVGLAETFLPSLLARKVHMATRVDELDLHQPLKIAMLFAPPRSGSSLVSDVMIDMGIGNTSEHLRDTLNDCLKSNYKCDWPQALRVFLQLSQQDGWVGTKLISHFLSDYISGSFRHELFAGLSKDGHKLYPMFLYRQNMVLQAISGFLASRRGIWHVIDKGTQKTLDDKSEVEYHFNAILQRFVNYRSQDAFLKGLETDFSNPLSLQYENDCKDLRSVSRRLSTYLKVDEPTKFEKSKDRKKIANKTNDDYERRFREDWETLFGKPLH